MRSIHVVAMVLMGCMREPMVDDAFESEDTNNGTNTWFATDSEDTDQDGGEYLEYEEIRCVDFGRPGDLCLGRLTGSKDAWVIATQNDKIDQMVVDGNVVDIDTWTDGCANGQAPTLMSEYRCLWHVEREMSYCYIGDGNYWTPVDRCVALSQAPAWTDYQCDGAAGSVGANPFDAIGCDNVQSGICRAQIGQDSMLIWPTCWVEAWPQVWP